MKKKKTYNIEMKKKKCQKIYTNIYTYIHIHNIMINTTHNQKQQHQQHQQRKIYNTSKYIITKTNIQQSRLISSVAREET